MEVQTNAPICKTQICKRPLTYLEDSKCWRCLVCNPIPKDTPKPKEEKKFLDVAMTEKRVVEMIQEALEKGVITYIKVANSKHPETVRVEIGEERIKEIVQDELMNWHIPKPPVTKDEIEEDLSEFDRLAPKLDAFFPETSSSLPVPPNWRQQAKALGISLMQPTGGVRKKVDVIADIERIQNGGSSRTEDQPEGNRYW